MRLRAAVLAVALASLAACGGERTSQCNEICEREARCTEQQRDDGDPTARFDAGECAAACKALERDKEGQALVDKHATCVLAAPDCAAILACE